MTIKNDVKIKVCNAIFAMMAHVHTLVETRGLQCDECRLYIRTGEGDLCPVGKRILAENLLGIVEFESVVLYDGCNPGEKGSPE